MGGVVLHRDGFRAFSVINVVRVSDPQRHARETWVKCPPPPPPRVFFCFGGNEGEKKIKIGVKKISHNPSLPPQQTTNNPNPTPPAQRKKTRVQRPPPPPKGSLSVQGNYGRHIIKIPA